MSEKRVTPHAFIALLRASDPVFMKNLYLNGGCYHLFKILKAVFPDAECWWSPREQHVYTKIGKRFYDIRGARRESDLILPVPSAIQTEGEDFLAIRFSHHGQGNMCDCGG